MALGDAATTLNQLVAAYEAPQGNPYGPGGNQGGAYQFVPSTWRRYLAMLGLSTSDYPTGSSAPPSVQDAVFAQAVSVRGLGDWTCPGCDPGLTSYLANNPSAASLPIVAGSVTGGGGGSAVTPTGTTTGASTGASGTGGPSVTNPLALGTGLWSGILQRFGYGAVGLVLVLAALAIYALRTRDQG